MNAVESILASDVLERIANQGPKGQTWFANADRIKCSDNDEHNGAKAAVKELLQAADGLLGQTSAYVIVGKNGTTWGEIITRPDVDESSIIWTFKHGDVKVWIDLMGMRTVHYASQTEMILAQVKPNQLIEDADHKHGARIRSVIERLGYRVHRKPSSSLIQTFRELELEKAA